MGFEVPRKTAKLTFELPEYAGLEVRISMDVSLETVFQVQNLQEEGKIEPLMRMFGDDILLDWNVERDGQAVPATAEGLLSLPTEFVTGIINAWSRTLGESAPLVQSSAGSSTASVNGGAQSPALSSERTQG